MSVYFQNNKLMTAQKLKQKFLAKQKDSDQLLSCTANQFINQLDTEIDEISSSYNIDPAKEKPQPTTIHVKQYLSQENEQIRPQPVPHQKQTTPSYGKYYKFLDKDKESGKTASVEASPITHGRHASLKIISKKPVEQSPKKESKVIFKKPESPKKENNLLEELQECAQLVQESVSMPSNIKNQDLFHQIQYIIQDFQHNLNGKQQEMSINKNIFKQSEDQKRDLLQRVKKQSEQIVSLKSECIQNEKRVVEVECLYEELQEKRENKKDSDMQTSGIQQCDAQVQTERKLSFSRMEHFEYGGQKGSCQTGLQEQQMETQMKLIQVLEQQIEQDRLSMQEQEEKIEEMGESRMQNDIQYRNMLQQYKQSKEEAKIQMDQLKHSIQEVNNEFNQQIEVTNQTETTYRSKLNALQNQLKTLKSQYDQLQMKNLGEQHFVLKIYKKLKQICQQQCLLSLASFTKKLKNKLKQDQQQQQQQQQTLTESNVINTNLPKYIYELPSGKCKKENKSESLSQSKVQPAHLARKPSLANEKPLVEEKGSMTLRQKLNQQRALLV